MMKLPLTIELDDDEVAAIASAKHTDSGDIDEIRDYLNGWVERGIEAAKENAAPLAPDGTPLDAARSDPRHD
jgi:hypothetical protein